MGNKIQYEKFTRLLSDKNDVDAVKLLNSLSQIQVASIIFMSQRSPTTEDHQLVGDFILSQNGRGDWVRGAHKLWE